MSLPDDETLMRWSDGELSPDAAARLEAAARTDPALAARMEAMGRSRQALAEAFPIAFDPRDADLARRIAAATAAPRPHALAGLRARIGELLAPRHAVPWAAFATAAFVGGLLLGPLASRDAGLTLRPDRTVADAGLQRVLDRRLASEGADEQGLSVGLTFQDLEGRWCRTFQSERDGWVGLACRTDGAWTVTALAALEASDGEVRMASSETPAAVLAAVDESIAGETADALAETRARDAGWR
ncbi:hypothetical protein IP78_11190 [Brevundimonas sp. AAP58]|uniref:hypothetical protein n=1 Tax=Brevundimonas sp. AAP58 TaxID=1523422 RepID=UPI0006B8F6F7|nr:hypothetical protein [Brevundimonas sp. AAP58]KPF78410.1 hypothetical protein IP78_11190 [Brevundimonas sp. AAP58]